MYGGAAVSAVTCSARWPFMGDIQRKGARVPGFTATPLTVTVVMVVFFVPVALWLWMARAVGQGRNWARILSTVLFGLATLQLTGSRGVVQVLTVALAWLIGFAVVWLRGARPPARSSSRSAWCEFRVFSALSPRCPARTRRPGRPLAPREQPQRAPGRSWRLLRSTGKDMGMKEGRG